MNTKLTTQLNLREFLKASVYDEMYIQVDVVIDDKVMVFNAEKRDGKVRWPVDLNVREKY